MSSRRRSKPSWSSRNVGDLWSKLVSSATTNGSDARSSASRRESSKPLDKPNSQITFEIPGIGDCALDDTGRGSFGDMSLFGSGANTTGSSLFGASTAATNTNSGSSLFGNNANTASTNTGATSLFGGNNAPATGAAPGSVSSLFGASSNTITPTGNNATTTQNNTSSLFGNSNIAAPSTTTTGTSLFGNNASTNANNTQLAGTSLFGSLSAPSAAPPTASLFNASTVQTQAPTTSSSTAANSSLFSGGILKTQEEQQATPADPNATAANPAYFDALLQRGRKRRADDHNASLGELPALQLGLQDISHKVRNLGQRGAGSGTSREADVRAHYLLAASGVDKGRARRDLQDLTGMAPGPAPFTASVDLMDGSGVKETLAQKYQNDFQKLVDSHIQRAQADFDQMIEEKLHGVDWESHRKRIYEHFGLKKVQQQDGDANGLEASTLAPRSTRRSIRGTSALETSYGIPGLTRSVIGTPGLKAGRGSVFGDIVEKMAVDGLRPAPEDRAQRVKQENFADQVKELNVARIAEKSFPILQRFSQVEAESYNEDSTMLVHAYQSLIETVGESPGQEDASDTNRVRERQYATAYLDDNANSPALLRVRKRILNGSRSFLEKLFFTQVEQTINRNPREANVGGVPTPIAKIKGYVRVRAARKELGPDIDILQEVNGDYCWPVLLYALRSGLYREAVEYVEENAAAFRQIDRSFVRYLRAYVASDDHRLPAEMQTAINNEYSQRTRLAPEDTIDPYRMVCYRIVGRCELQKRSLSSISNDVMDWLWFQFVMAREYNRVDEFAHEAFGLDELQASIKEIGEKWFGPGSDVANAPTMLCFMQVAAGMYEKAVADLYAHNYVSATHLAIALDFYGLLRVSDISNSNDLLTYTTRNQPQIAFGSMIGLYTRDFRTADATAAVDYLTLICLNKDLDGEIGKRQRELCHQALTEVVLETREFAQLLGDVRADGQRIKGTIEQRLMLIGLENEQDFLKHITLVAARTAEEQSRATDAALLYHLGEDYDKVTQVINEALSIALTTELGEQPARLTPLKPRQVSKSPEDPARGQDGSSLSLTAVDDPIEFARIISVLYGRSQMYYSKIRNNTKESCMVLLRLAAARESLENGDWPFVIDQVTSARILPMEAQGNMSAIRAAATTFNGLPSVVSRTAGYVLLWTILACARNIERLKSAEFETGTQQATIQACLQTSKDIMVFAGLIRFKLPGRVWESLAQIGGEMGAF